MKKEEKSRFEMLAREYMAYYLWQFEPTYNERPDFLKNEATQKNLELDIWYKSLGLAVEINGITHKLKKIRRRDLWKLKRCHQKGIKLFVVGNIYDLAKDLHGRGMHELANTIKPYPYSRKKVLWEYKPSKTAFNNLHSRVKRQLKMETAYSAQEKERKDNLRRLRIKHGNEYKVVEGRIILSEYA